MGSPGLEATGAQVLEDARAAVGVELVEEGDPDGRVLERRRDQRVPRQPREALKAAVHALRRVARRVRHLLLRARRERPRDVSVHQKVGERVVAPLDLVLRLVALRSSPSTSDGGVFRDSDGLQSAFARVLWIEAGR